MPSTIGASLPNGESSRLLVWIAAIIVSVALPVPVQSQTPQTSRPPSPWKRHTIDDTSRGADGVRLADINGDGRADLVCGWEEGGVIRVYLQPERSLRKEPWPRVTVGKVKSPEDAVFADVDQDGNWDVVSSTEGRSRQLFVHWSPGRQKLLQASAWRTQSIPAARELEMWMFALPMELDGRPGPELIVGSKNSNASISLLAGPAELKQRRDLSKYRLQRLYDAGWIMSLMAVDIDQDGDDDVLTTDRKGSKRGVWWLENPGVQAVRDGAPWQAHQVTGKDMEVMFLDYGPFGKAEPCIVTATRNKVILVSRRPRQSDPAAPSDLTKPWPTETIDNPFATPNGKAVAIADVNGDGQHDLIHTVNNGGKRQHRGATWLEATSSGWKTHDISGERGVKFDLIQIMDVDEDGDIDFLSCEERDNLGLFWYENPTK